MVKLSVEQFADVTSILFAAALDPTQWQAFLDRLSTHLGIIQTHMYGYDVASRLGLDMLYHGYDDAFMQSYSEHYGAMNTWAEGLFRAPVGQVVTSAQCYPEEELFKSEFYNGWVRPQNDVRTGAGVVLAKDDTRVFLIGGNMQQRHAEHEQDWVDTLKLLAPHMRRAIEISRTVFDNSIQVIAAQKFNAIPSGGALVALTATRQVIYANAVAHSLAEAGAVLRLSTLGRLHFLDRDLDRALQQALDGMRLRQVPPSATLQLSNPGGGIIKVRFARIESDRLTAMPLGMASGIGEPHLLVALSAPAEPVGSEHVLRRGFGLTESELRVAALIADGLTSREIADIRQVSVHTVRDQIKSALSKTGSHRQAELVRLLQDLRGRGGEG